MTVASGPPAGATKGELEARAPGQATSERRRTESRVALALDLGWRVAELHGLDEDDVCIVEERLEREEQMAENLLPARRSLDKSDQLELQLRAAAGDAERLGVRIESEALDCLLDLAASASSWEDDGRAFGDHVRRCHVSLGKQLWAISETEGRAYELGTFLYDTWGRIHRAYATAADPPTSAERKSIRCRWCSVFARHRTEELKVLLDDLESRIDPSSVTIVRNQIDTWRARVEAHVAPDRDAPIPTHREACRALRRQTLIWRQLLTGGKEPEAYIGEEGRAGVRDEFARFIRRRYLRTRVLVPLGLGLLFASVAILLAVLNAGAIASWYEDNETTATAVFGVLATIAGVFGVSRASIALGIRNNFRTWSQLLWNRALASVIAEATLTLNEQENRGLLPAPAPRPHRALARLRREVTEAAARVRHALERIRSWPRPRPGH